LGEKNKKSARVVKNSHSFVFAFVLKELLIMKGEWGL